MSRPLEGLLVLDFTTLLPGPLATLTLAEAGAEVIKIERPGGEETRAYPPFDGAGPARASAPFALLNRGKKSVVLDLKSEADRARLVPLLARADVLVEQFRPGVMDRLGLGYEACRAVNPRLVYCSITGYGQTGPKADEAGHDLNYQAATGLLALAPGPAEAPRVPNALVADIAGGTLPALLNVMIALYERGRTGVGRHLDVAMADGCFPFTVFAEAELAATGHGPAPNRHMLAGGSPRYRLYPAKDGQLVAVAALEQKFWETLADTLGLDAAARDDRRDPARAHAAVAAAIAARTGEEWRPILRRADCCASVVASLAEAMADPHFAARGHFDHRVAMPSGADWPAAVVPLAPGYRGAPTAKAAPALGADTDAVLGAP